MSYARNSIETALQQIEDDVRALEARRKRLLCEIENTERMTMVYPNDKEVLAFTDVKELLLSSKRRELQDIDDDITARLKRKVDLESQGTTKTIIFVIAAFFALLLAYFN